MNRFLSVSAAALVLGGVTFLGCDRDKTASTSTDSTSTTTPPSTQPSIGDKLANGAGAVGNAVGNAVNKTSDAVGEAASKIAPSTSRDINGVRRLLADFTNAGLTKGGLSDMDDRFAKADRDRLEKDIKAQNTDQLDGVIAQFQKDWQAKYHEDFKVKDATAVFNDSFLQFSAGNNAVTAGAQVAANVDANGAKTDATTNPSAAANAETGTAIVAASQGAPELTIPLVYETASWKMQIPESMTAPKLMQNVQAALTKLDQNKDQWPADMNDGYRAVCHTLLLAVFDKMPA